MRLSQAARKFNISTETIVQYLKQKSTPIDANPNTKLTSSQLQLLIDQFASSVSEEKPIKPVVSAPPPTLSAPSIKPITPTPLSTAPQTGFRIVGTIDLSPAKPPKKSSAPAPPPCFAAP